MKTLKLTTLLLLNISAFIQANPIVLDSTVLKAWEKCMIAVDRDSAKVSCAVGYRKVAPIQGKLYFSVPVFVATVPRVDFKAVQKAFEMRLECNGKFYTVRDVALPNDGLPSIEQPPPGNMIKVYFYFAIDAPPEEEFMLVVTYSQPLIANVVYYLPLFENAEKPADITNYSVTFFPTQNNILNLLTKHKMVNNAMQTRIDVHPSDSQIISVKSSPVQDEQK